MAACKKDPATSPSSLKREFASRGLSPLKSLGQNFLADENILQKISRLAGPLETDLVLEIGAGPGNLTRHLATAGKVIAVEIDRGLAALASENLEGFDNVEVMHADVLEGKGKLNPDVLGRIERDRQSYSRLVVVSNTPYPITTPLISALAVGELEWERAILMVQREILDRLTASPGTKKYGVLSVIAGLAVDTEIVIDRVPPQVFWPSPGVTSSVVALTPTARLADGEMPGEEFGSFLKAIFSVRRKTIGKSLKKLGYLPEQVEKTAAALAESGFSTSNRFEECPPDVILAVYGTVRKPGR